MLLVLSVVLVAGYPLISTGATIYRSTDGGAKWTAALPNIGHIKSMDLDGKRGVAVDGSGGIWVSGDQGQTWVKMATCPQANDDAAAHGQNMMTVGYAGSLCYSTDGGKTFSKQILKDSQGNNVHLQGVTIATVQGKVTALAVGNTKLGHQLFRSVDRGKTFKALSSLPAAPKYVLGKVLMLNSGEVLMLSKAVLHRSKDAGNSWKHYTLAGNYTTLTAVAHEAPGRILITGTSAHAAWTRVYLSLDDGKTFPALTDPVIKAAGFPGVAFNGAGLVYMGGKSNKLVRSKY